MPPKRTGSDPGPRGLELARNESTHSSLATENSDDEPLVGEPAIHVEAMLRKCLAPDERDGGGGRDEEEEEDDSQSDSGFDDGYLEGEADSDLDDIEEEHALRLQVSFLKHG